MPTSNERAWVCLYLSITTFGVGLLVGKWGGLSELAIAALVTGLYFGTSLLYWYSVRR